VLLLENLHARLLGKYIPAKSELTDSGDMMTGFGLPGLRWGAGGRGQLFPIAAGHYPFKSSGRRLESPERLKGRGASPGRINQPNDAFSLAACVQAKKMGTKANFFGANQPYGEQRQNIGENNSFGRMDQLRVSNLQTRPWDAGFKN
jgi:hypothetical protein